MAVQAQYPANVLLLSRGEAERNGKEMEANFPPPLLEQAPVFLNNNGGNVNPRKRGREVAVVLQSAVLSPPPPEQHVNMNMFSLQAPSLTPAMLGLAQLQSSTPSIVSTGLHLTFKGQNQREPTDSIFSSFSDHLSTEIDRQKSEIEQFLATQVEQLRREMASQRQHQCRILLEAVDTALGKKLREKEAEAEFAGRRTAELQGRLAGLRAESMAWQEKAVAEQAAAANLHAQLQQAAAAAAVGGECSGEWPAGDAASAHVDPDRPKEPNRPCRSCHRRPASVVLLPCRHLCVCPACDSAGAASAGCPACGCFRTGSLQVFFS